ncbi:hypothetical protein B0H15DRAFT_958744 [Mycena belliarum]|uniref:Uncharacterized protein n=1 Tax=Mycena belliarum TaxID=1033014 RepID=A0AAD6XFF3_9AGAR|nr:hypothetical protein B0H15DRAFT_958744 [Mycena belliae]
MSPASDETPTTPTSSESDSIFSDDESPADAASFPADPATVITYEVSTTSIIRGLPPVEQQRIVRSYRAKLFGGPHDPSCPDLLSYDLSCQYLKNLDALEKGGPHTDSDSELDVSDDSGPPPLLSATPSDVGSPVMGGERTGLPSADAPGATPAGFIPASTLGRTDGEHIEREWARVFVPTPGLRMGEGYRSHYLYSDAPDAHDLRIVSLLHKSQEDVCCDCRDGRHSVYTRVHVYAFLDVNGDVVVKKAKTKLLPLV